MSIPALSKHSARAIVAAGVLALATVPGATAASAAVMHPTKSAVPADVSNAYSCTDSAPEFCIGVYYSGGYVYNVEENADIPGYSPDVTFVLGATGGYYGTADTWGGAGWVGPVEFNINAPYSSGSWFCGSFNDGEGNGNSACVQLP